MRAVSLVTPARWLLRKSLEGEICFLNVVLLFLLFTNSCQYTLTIVCLHWCFIFVLFSNTYRAAAKKSKKKTAAAISSEDQPPVPPQSGDEADGEFSEGAFNATEETDPDLTAATTPAAGPKKPKMKSRTPSKPKPNK